MSSLPFRRIEKIFGSSRQYSPQVLALLHTELRSSTQSQVLLKLIHGFAAHHQAAYPRQRPNIGKTEIGDTLPPKLFHKLREYSVAVLRRKVFHDGPSARGMRQHSLQQRTARMHHNFWTNRDRAINPRGLPPPVENIHRNLKMFNRRILQRLERLPRVIHGSSENRNVP